MNGNEKKVKNERESSKTTNNSNNTYNSTSRKYNPSIKMMTYIHIFYAFYHICQSKHILELLSYSIQNSYCDDRQKCDLQVHTQPSNTPRVTQTEKCKCTTTTSLLVIIVLLSPEVSNPVFNFLLLY